MGDLLFLVEVGLKVKAADGLGLVENHVRTTDLKPAASKELVLKKRQERRDKHAANSNYKPGL